MATAKRRLALLLGGSCVGIGLVHLTFGIASVPGEREAGATVDSRERYYGAVFAAYGAAWIWAGRRSALDATALRFLGGSFLVGGLGRLLSLAQHGRPHWFQLVLAALELILPLPFLVPPPKPGRHQGGQLIPDGD